MAVAAAVATIGVVKRAAQLSRKQELGYLFLNVFGKITEGIDGVGFCFFSFPLGGAIAQVYIKKKSV